MRMHMDYGCYSARQLKWIALIGLPSILVWIVGAPFLAFYILFKNRDNLEDDKIKKYFLILYQGLNRKVFYWEFVNTIRKVLVLTFNTIFSIFSIFYRVICCIVLLLVIIRIQLKLRPYKHEDNNRIEIRAIVAGMMTLY